MTPEQFGVLIAAVGGSTAFLALVQLITKLIDVYAGRQTAGDETTERKDGISQDDKARLWKRVDQLESDRAASEERHERQLAALRDRHDRELTEVRTKLDKVVIELAAAQKVIEVAETERLNALTLHKAAIQLHEVHKVAFEDVKKQFLQVQAENAELRQRLGLVGTED